MTCSPVARPSVVPQNTHGLIEHARSHWDIMSQRRRNAKGKTPGASSFDGQREAVCMKAHGLVGVGVLPSCGGGRSVPGHGAGEGLAGCAEHGVMNTRAAEAPWTRDPGRQPRCRWSRFGLAVPQALRREVRAPAGDHWGSSPDWGSSPGRVGGGGGGGPHPCGGCCFRARWARPGRSAAALAPGPARVVFLLVPALPWPARPVTLAALAWWSQSWPVHSMTIWRVGRAG